ncbi:alpha/beta hydrolase [Bacillus cereus]|uniref:alpha/beta hydrolase n=1 Tax=Bacillus cereus TaxID=1396 RepID=UPI002EDB74F3
MIIDTEVDELLKSVREAMIKLGHPPLEETTPEQMRYYDKKARKFFSQPSFEGIEVINIQIDNNDYNIPARIYKPLTHDVLPMLVYFHGGGWVFSDLDSSDYICSYISKNANCIVMSVAYRLAPENKYPIPLEDCYTAVKWAYENRKKLAASNLSIGGESSGANLAAAVALKLRDNKNFKPTCQLLITPVIKYHFDTESYNNNYNFNLTKEKMKIFWNQYLHNDKQGEETYASPLLARVNNLPPALIVSAELDPLRDDGKLYALHLEEANIPVKYLCFNSLVHSFIHMAEKSKLAKEALDDIIREFRILIRN